MVWCTQPYLDLAGIPEVGVAQLDPRPALVIAADGTQVLWANAAGAAFLGEPRIGDLLRQRFSDLNPIKAQAARLAKLLPSASARMEILRFGQGTRLASVAAACRRLNLPDGTRAILVIVAEMPPAESLTARAERLVDLVGAGDCLAAVLTGEGKVLAASDAFDALMPVEPAIDRLIEDALASSRTVIKSNIGSRRRQAGVVRFSADGRPLLLLIVGPHELAAAPPESAHEPPPESSPEASRDLEAFDETPIEAMFPDLADETLEDNVATAEPFSSAAAIVRFVWETDRAGRFTFISPDLAAAVGDANGAIAGRSWGAIDAALGLDPDGLIAEALANATSFSATVRWPVAGADDRVAVELTGQPVRTPGGAVSGFRGFGLCRMDDRQPDLRTDKAGLPPLTAPPEAPSDRPPPAAEAEADAAAGADHRDLDDAARMSVEEGADKRFGARLVAVTGRGRASNVVQLSGAGAQQAERLSGTEREAFRRIAEALGAKRPEASGEGRRAEAGAPAETGKHIAGDRAADIDTRLLDRLPLGIVIFRDRKTLFANRTLLDLLGYNSLDAFVASGGPEAIFPGGDALASNIVEAGGRLAASRNGGGTVAVRAWLHAVTFAGATALMLSIANGGGSDSEDASAAEVARSAARADELEAILDTATDGVIVMDARGKIGSMNRAAEALFGINAGDYRGRYFTDLLADESQKPALDYLDGLAANGVASVLNDGREVIGRVPQGGLIPLFMTMGRVAGTEKFCAVLRDITHWKNVEEELTAARRAAEAANQQKSDFLAKISHEIRTPLNAIIGFSELMIEERFGPIGNTRYRDYLRDIHVSGAHLMSLINDLLDLSKIEAGKVELSFEAVAVNGFIQESVALMQPQANRERIIIRTSLAADLPNVVADARSFRQILLNLLSNAIKFTRAGGQVIVSTSLEDSGEIVVRIRDTGIGMSEKDIETALKPFRQVALSADDREHGTGLGLPLTKALVEANRAAFGIESAPNQGTLVKITFPTTRVLAG